MDQQGVRSINDVVRLTPGLAMNGVDAHGGSIGSAGPTVAAGHHLLITSGCIGMQGGSGGNVLLAFGL